MREQNRSSGNQSEHPEEINVGCSRTDSEGKVIMGVLRKGVDRLENRTRKKGMKGTAKKKSKPKKSGKDRTEVTPMIPSRRRKKR